MQPAALPHDTVAILRARARALAREPEREQAAGTTLEVVEFSLAHERYALETACIAEVCPLEDLTPLPCTPAFVLGLVNVRRSIFPVIDLKRFFDLPEPGITDLHRILIVDAHDMKFGLLADAIAGVRSIRTDQLQPALPTMNGIRAEYLKGLTPDRVVILNPHAIASDRRILVHEEVEQ
jgi:Chemotaxis signal transduction protein